MFTPRLYTNNIRRLRKRAVFVLSVCIMHSSRLAAQRAHSKKKLQKIYVYMYREMYIYSLWKTYFTMWMTWVFDRCFYLTRWGLEVCSWRKLLVDLQGKEGKKKVCNLQDEPRIFVCKTAPKFTGIIRHSFFDRCEEKKSELFI